MTHRRKTPRALHPLLPTLLLLSGTGFAQDDILVRWHDVRALQAVSFDVGQGVDMRLHVRSSYLDSLEPDHYDVRLEEPFRIASYGWSDVLLGSLGERWSGGTFFVEPVAGFLRVEADAATQEEVARVLADFEAQMLRTVELELFLVPASALPSDCAVVLDAAELQALLEASPAFDQWRTLARMGRRARLGGRTLTPHLFDYDVEVASKARVADSQVTVMQAGIEVGALVREHVDGRLFLRVWGRRGVAGPTRRIELESLAGGALELPSMSSTLLAASALVPDGGGVVLGQCGAADGVWLIRARETRRARSAAPGGTFVPLGSLTSEPLHVSPPWPARTAPSGGWAPRDDFLTGLGDEERDPVLSEQEILELLRLEQEREPLDGSLFVLPDVIYVRGSDALLERTRRLVRQWTSELSPANATIDVRYGLLERGAAERIARESVEPAALLAELDRRLVSPCRLGDGVLVVAGTERFYLKDHDVEIAEATAIADPILSHVFDGVSFWCRLNPVRGGRIAAWVDLQLHVSPPSEATFPVATWKSRAVDLDEIGPVGEIEVNAILELPWTSLTGERTLTVVERGEWSMLCTSALPGTDRTLVAIWKID